MYLALDDREDLPEKVLTEMKCLWSNKRVRRHHQI